MKEKVKFGIICDLGVTFKNDWHIFGARFTRRVGISSITTTALSAPDFCGLN